MDIEAELWRLIQVADDDDARRWLADWYDENGHETDAYLIRSDLLRKLATRTVPFRPPVTLAGMARLLVPPLEPLTNIGASDLADPNTARRVGAASRAKYGLPVGTNLDEIQPDPDWTTRWQNSKSPPDEAPWVRGFRWWLPEVTYRTWHNPDGYRIDFMWKDHRHAYYRIPRSVWEEFRDWTDSVGQWFHDNILVAGWDGKRVKGVRYPDFPL